jgi:lycopene cyclase domain-containing protein
MTYTQLALISVAIAIVLDLWVFRTKLLTRRVFWVSYSIVIFFQLVTNGILTGFGIVEYDGDAIIGSSTPETIAPQFIGDGRLIFAPIEDLFFGFSLVVLSLIFWVALGRAGIQREPVAGPPRRSVWRFLGIKP